MINAKPTKCNLCGGVVVYASNSVIYGKEYGSGKCYLCKECGAYVGTHRPRPTEALGLLADKEMRDMKMKCHDLFDKKWRFEKNSRKRHIARRKAYAELADKLNISVNECHFGYFDINMLNKAYGILSTGSDSIDK